VAGPAGERKREEMSQTFVSWNQIHAWLRQVKAIGRPLDRDARLNLGA
jgi:hypothetical protein